MDAWQEESEQVAQSQAIHAFLLGCANREAALQALHKEPNSVDEALKYIRQAAYNIDAVIKKSKGRSVRSMYTEEDNQINQVAFATSEIVGDDSNIRQLKSPTSKITFKDNEVHTLQKDMIDVKKQLGDLIACLKANKDYYLKESGYDSKIDRNDHKPRYPSGDRYRSRYPSGDRYNDQRTRYPSRDRYEDRSRSRFSSRDRYDDRSRSRFSSKDRYDDRSKNDEYKKYKSRSLSGSQDRDVQGEKEDDNNSLK